MKMSIGAAVSWLAARAPDHPALTFWDRTVTRRELDETTNRLARAYQHLGVRQGDLVTIVLPNGIEFYEACIATWKLGATPQPLSAGMPPMEREAIVDLARPALVVGIDIARSASPTIPATFDLHHHFDNSPLPDLVAPSWKAMTSGGSTGRPKLIIDGHPGLVDPEISRFSARALLPGDCQLVAGPTYHNGPFVFSVSGLFCGGNLVIMPKFDAVSALAAMEAHGVNWAFLVPTMMHRIWRVPEAQRTSYDLGALRGILHLAAPCPDWLKQAWIEWLGADRIFEAYGATESIASTVITGGEWLAHRGSVGRADPARFEIRAADGTRLPCGEIGEIWMRAEQHGTYAYVGSVSKRGVDGWDTVGDLGWVDADGYLYIADRRTDLIISGGSNIYPAEVEAAIDSHAGVLSSAVVGLPDDDLGQRVHAIVQTTSGAAIDDLLSHLSQRLARYKIPRTIAFTSDVLRDDAGKMRRSSLAAQESSRAVSSASIAEGANPAARA